MFVAALNVSTCLLFLLVGIAAVTDIRRREIYNATTYPGIVAALALNAVGSLLELTVRNTTTLQRVIGWIGFQQSCIGFLVCGLLLVVCIVFFQVGGGDVKLMAMIGAFLGLYKGIEVVLWTFVLGAALGVLLLIWRVGVTELVRGGLRRVGMAVKLRDPKQLALPSCGDTSTALFMAPSALAAVVLVHFDWVAHL